MGRKESKRCIDTLLNEQNDKSMYWFNLYFVSKESDSTAMIKQTTNRRCVKEAIETRECQPKIHLTRVYNLQLQ